MRFQATTPHIKSRHHQRGVNLIEIMVATVIGLFLVLGATTLYVNSKKTADVDDSIARLQETARYALSVIETDVRMANYWGTTKDGSNVDNKDSNLNLPMGANASALGAGTGTNFCGAAYATNTELYIEATNNRFNFSCTASSGAASSADTLTVRRAGTAVITTPVANQLATCTNRKLALVTKGSTVCDGGEFHYLMVNGYYIDQGSDQNSTYPSLRRKTLIAGPAFRDDEIIPGVEDMQIELGWDDSYINSAGAVRYVQPETGGGVLTTGTCATTGTAASTTGNCEIAGRIVAVRVWLLIRAETPDTGFTDTRTYSYADRTGAVTATLTAGQQYRPNDGFRRLLVSRTIFVRNATGT